LIVAPVPTSAPPQLPEYHFQLAPVPSEPPTTLKSALPPGQTLLGLAVALVGAADSVFTVTVRLLDAPLPQLLLGVTDTLPEVVPQLTVIEVVPWPVTTVAPAGTVQV
jgi:hypothetical protein